MKILITGAAGYIGTALVETLSNHKDVEHIIAYDNLSRENLGLLFGDRKLNDKITFVKGEILDEKKLRKHMQKCDVCIHLAAEVSTPYADVNHHLFEQINHWGTANVCGAAEECGIKNFIYFSSASVFGFGTAEFNVEDNPKPVSLYGKSKLRGENHVNRLKDQMQVCIVRCANVFGFGASMRFDAVLNRFNFDARYKGRITLQGDGTQYRSFVHIHNVCKAVAQLLENDKCTSPVILADRNERINDAAHELEKVYPELERIFISSHLQLGSLKLEIDDAFNSKAGFVIKPLREHFSDFKTHFRF